MAEGQPQPIEPEHCVADVQELLSEPHGPVPATRKQPRRSKKAKKATAAPQKAKKASFKKAKKAKKAKEPDGSEEAGVEPPAAPGPVAKAKKAKKAKKPDGSEEAGVEPPAAPGPVVRPVQKKRKAPSGADSAEAMHPSAYEGIVPPEAYPQTAPKGKENYSLHAETSGSIIEVQLKTKAFYMRKAPDMEGFKPRSLSWKKYGGASNAWLLAKTITGWA